MRNIILFLISITLVILVICLDSIIIRAIIGLLVLAYIIYLYHIKIPEPNKKKYSGKNKILTDTDIIDSAFNATDDDNWNAARSCAITVFFTCLVSLITTDSFNDFGFIDASQWKIVFIVVLAISLAALIIILVHNINNGYIYKPNTSQKVKEYILERNKYEINDTLILLFPKIEKNSINFFAGKNNKWEDSLFFPYVPLDEKEEIRDNITTKISEKFGFKFPIGCHYLDMMNHNSIKISVEKNNPININYKYVVVYPLSSFLLNEMYKILKSKNFNKYTIDQLKSDYKTSVHNNDVINQIENHITTINEIVNNTIKERPKIIWNISKKCNKGCAFCAYGSSNLDKNHNLDISKAKAIIDSLSSISIRELDIATGNVVDTKILTEILEYAASKLRCSLSLTSTHDVLSTIDKEFLKNKNIKIEITYDYPIKKSTHDLRPQEYNEKNYNLAKQLIQDGLYVSALVVIHSNINNDILRNIKKDLDQIKIKDVLFIRLMPVGNQKLESYPNKLLEESTYSFAKKIVKENKEYRLHCALSSISNNIDGKYCSQAFNKLGIDCNGNVYTCPWAEHLDNPTTTPFFIGNINDFTDMKEMLIESANYNKVISESALSRACKIFCYVKTGKMHGDDLLK